MEPVVLLYRLLVISALGFKTRVIPLASLSRVSGGFLWCDSYKPASGQHGCRATACYFKQWSDSKGYFFRGGWTFYRQQRSCGQGNNFTPVCHSFCSQGGVCLSACWDTTPPGTRYTPLGSGTPPGTKYTPLGLSIPPRTKY